MILIHFIILKAKLYCPHVIPRKCLRGKLICKSDILKTGDSPSILLFTSLERQ